MYRYFVLLAAALWLTSVATGCSKKPSPSSGESSVEEAPSAQEEAVEATVSPPPDVEALLARAVQAVQDADYEAFVALGDQGMKTGVTPESFKGMTETISLQLQGDHTVTYLDREVRGDETLHVWALAFSDGSPERTVQIRTEGGEVASAIIFR